MLLEISKGRRVKPPEEIYPPEDLLLYTLRGITRKYVRCFWDSVESLAKWARPIQCFLASRTSEQHFRPKSPI